MNHPLKKTLIVLAVGLAVFGAGRTAHAANDVWTGTGGDANWSTGANWSLGAMPGAGDMALIGGYGCVTNCSPTINTSTNISGMTLNGSNLLSPYNSSGKVASDSVSFNGTDDYFGVNYDLPRASSTVSFWIKTTATSTGISEWSNTGYTYSNFTDRVFYVNASGSIVFYVYNGGSCNNATYNLVSSSTINDGTWHLVTATWSTTAKSLYIDGGLEATSSVGIQASTGAMPYLTIGEGYGAGCFFTPARTYFNGSLDDFRVYTDVLSSSSINTIYTGGTYNTSLVGRWNFEATPADSSGSGHNATFSGTPAGTINGPSFTVTQASGSSITLGAGNYTQSGSGATFTGSSAGDGIRIAGWGSFNMTGGTFTNTTGNLTIDQNFVASSGTYNGNNGSLVFYNAYHGINHLLFCNSVLSNNTVKTITWDDDAYITVSSTAPLGCSINLGSSPTTNVAWINYGIITVNSGTWTNNSPSYTNQNWGIINVTSTSILNFNGWNEGFIQETATATVNGPSGMTLNLGGDLNIALISSTTWPANMNVNFETLYHGQLLTLTCVGSPLGIVGTINYDNDSSIKIVSGCSINLGTSPTEYNNWINYGTITVASGTWTNNSSGMNQNWGTINATNSMMIDFAAGQVEGFTMETATSTFNGPAGMTMQVSDVLDIRLISTSTWPANVNVNFRTWQHGEIDTLYCVGSPLGIVGTLNWDTDSYIQIISGCSINLGPNPVEYNAWINHGTINIPSGTWTNYGTVSSQNWGVINATNTYTWNWNNNTWDGFIVETATSTVNGPTGMTMNFSGDVNMLLASPGTTWPTGVNMNLEQWQHGQNLTLTCSGSPLATLGNPFDWDEDGTITITSGCSVSLGTNPLVYNAWINYGTISASGTWQQKVYANTQNYGTINVGGSINWTTGNVYHDGLIMKTSTSTMIAAAGTQMTFTGDLDISTGTWPSGINATLALMGYSPTLACNPTGNLNTVILTGGSANTVTLGGTPCTFTGDFDIYSGIVANPGSAYTVTVYGNYNQSTANTVGGSNLTLAFTGSATSTINITGGTFNSKIQNSKSGLAETMLSSDLSVPYTCYFQSGVFDVNSHNLTCTGATTIDVNGWLADYAAYASTIKLGSTMTNNGVVFLDGSGSVCVSPYPQFVTLQSTASGTQRTWSGSGENIVRYTKVQDQTGGGVTVWNGTDLGNNGWTFQNNYGRAQLVQSAPNINYTSGGTLNIPSFGFPPRPGDLIVVAVSAANQAITAPTDNASNTYYLATSTTFTTSGPWPTSTLAVYYAQNIHSLSPSNTMVIQVHGTGGGSSYIAGNAFEFVGPATSSTFDTSGTNTDTSGNAVTLTTPTVTGRSTKDELMFALAVPGMTASTTAVSAGSGWLALPSQQAVGGVPGLIPEYLSATSSAAAAATWTSAASTTYGAILAIFDPPGANGNGYAPTGTLDSPIFDTQSANGAQLNSVTWSGTATQGAGVAFQFAVSNSPSGPWTFIGPSGDNSTYFPNSGPSTNAGTPISLVSNAGGSGYGLFSGYRYFRYRLILFSGNNGTVTPTVSGVNVNWSP